MTDTELINFASDFREGILEGRTSEGMCFVIAAPLESLLRICGVGSRLIMGDLEETNHCWLLLDDGRVLDPTADQFNGPGVSPLPPVYLGEPTNLHPSN